MSRSRPQSRVDERDVMFARMARMPGTAAYGDFYARRPEWKKRDDHIRSLPELMRPGGRHYEPDIAAEAEQAFRNVETIRAEEGTVAEWERTLQRSSCHTRTLKEMALALGAVGVGCAPIFPELVYSHKGRFDEDYGTQIRLAHPSAVVFLVEMDFQVMQAAPLAPVLRESARAYLLAAAISKTMAEVIRRCGHDAKSHHDAHYDLILPPLAMEAGLGELGRNNILIAKSQGSRVRIGAVSTDLPLVHDSPIDLGADRFCARCRKCAESCPSRALCSGDKQEIRGVWKWPTDAERCYAHWRRIGTDCGICMAVCPFSHQSHWFHNGVRWMVRRASLSHGMALAMDNLVYGRRWG